MAKPMFPKIYSSSEEVGATQQTLTIEINSTLLSEGQLSLKVPQYYNNSDEHYMINQAQPECTGDKMVVSSCEFNFDNREVLIVFAFNDGNRHDEVINFYVKPFNNPITPLAKGNFQITTFDKDKNPIAKSHVKPVLLENVKKPTSFGSVFVEFNDTTEVGAHTIMIVKIFMKTPVADPCYVEVDFPKEFLLDKNLQKVTGYGIFAKPVDEEEEKKKDKEPKPEPAETEEVVAPYESISYNKGTIVVAGCLSNLGQDANGTLVFERVKNPLFVNDTETFKVRMSVDKEMTQVIATQTTGIIINQEQLRRGKIKNINIRPFDAKVQAEGFYSFDFEPSSSMDKTSQIEISLPPMLKFTKECKYDYESTDFGDIMECQVRNNKITLIKPFPYFSYDGNTPLTISLGPIKNPQAVENIGPFKITTYAYIDKRQYYIDEATVDNVVQTQPGLVKGISPLISRILTTYAQNSVYTFSMRFEHNVPKGGRVRIDLPNSMSIVEKSQIENECYQLVGESSESLNCEAGEGYFDIRDPEISTGQVFVVAIAGIRNPRFTGDNVLFQISSFNRSLKLIDMSSFDPNLQVAMDNVGVMRSIIVQVANRTNGASSPYTFTMTPNTPLMSGDELTFEFPEEVSLPLSQTIKCNSTMRKIPLLACTRSGPHEVRVIFKQIDGVVEALNPVSFTLFGVTNPSSSRPSQTFANWLLKDESNRMITSYKSKLTIRNEFPGWIQEFELDQSDRKPKAVANYTIKLYTNNPVPPNATFVIQSPKMIQILSTVGGCKVESRDYSVHPSCEYNGQEVTIPGGFQQYDEPYNGKISLTFTAVNPREQMSSTESISVIIFDDESTLYQIDHISDHLNPSFSCDYPCNTCTAQDSGNCTSCKKGYYDPKYLQTFEDDGYKTCTEKCADGYTYSSLITDYLCRRCDIPCKTCRYGGTKLDAEQCLTCTDEYPVFWQEGAKCYSVEKGCPSGTFPDSKSECLTCPHPCLDCKSADECLVCDSKSNMKYLQNGKCLESCEASMTPMTSDYGQFCQACVYPCRTCADGFPEKCLTCAGGEYPYVFAGQCMKECPAGTDQDDELFKCDGCLEGCEECEQTDQSTCIVCGSGLALHLGNCLAKCPEGFVKSWTGSYCEKWVDPMDEMLFFPFFTICGVFSIASYVSFRLHKGQTELLQCFMASSSVAVTIGIVSLWFQAIDAEAPLIITNTTLFIIGSALINFAYIGTFFMSVDDYQFNQYKSMHKLSYAIVMVLSLSLNFNVFRIFYAKLFDKAWTCAVATDPEQFRKPIRLFSLVYVITICGPNILLNMYYLGFRTKGPFWTTQLQLTMFELIILSLLLTGLVIYERVYIKYKIVIFKSSGENPFFAKGKGFDQERRASEKLDRSFRKDDEGSETQLLGQLQIDEVKFTPCEAKIERHDNLQRVIACVKANHNVRLNEGLDNVMEVEQLLENELKTTARHNELDLKPKDKSQSYVVQPQENKCDTQPSPRLNEMIDNDFDDDPLNHSFPGCNPAEDVLEDRGLKKRILLLQYMELKVEENRNIERLQEQARERLYLYQDKASMYDNEHFDNCFFSPKNQMKDGVAQTLETKMITKLSKSMNTTKAYPPQPRDVKTNEEMVQTNIYEYKDKRVQTVAIPESEQLKKLAEQISGPKKSSPKKNMLEGAQPYIGLQSFRGNDTKSGQIRDKGREGSPSQGLGSGEGDEFDQTSKSGARLLSSQELQKSNLKDQQLGVSNMSSIKVNSVQNGDEHHSRRSLITDSFNGDLASPNNLEESPTMTLQEKLSRKLVECDLTSFLAGSEQPETNKWVKRVKLMKTLMLDGAEPRKRTVGPGASMKLESAPATDKPTSKTNTARQPNVAQKKKKAEPQIVHHVYEESIASDEEAFYYANGHNDQAGSESISSVDTADLDPPIKQDRSKDLNAFLREEVTINQRSFNVHEVLGNFPLDNKGRIINRKEVIRRNKFRDMDSQLVNEKGYLINEQTGAIRSRFTYEDLFMPIQERGEDFGDLSMPYRLEKWNFNAHKIMGNFDYDLKTKKPVFLKNKYGQLTDKNFRPVNQSGFLINEREDIIDNDGHVKFNKEMLKEMGNIPNLLNYQGKAYKIQDVIGQVKKDPHTKDIIVKTDHSTGRAIDDLGRPINAAGYLIDKDGNIVECKNQTTILNFWELIQQEPPKLFSFTEFSIDWIRGSFTNGKQKFDPREDYQYDNNKCLVNTAGYLIDKNENVVDRYGSLVFIREILAEKQGQDSEIPRLFRCGKLDKPVSENQVLQQALQMNIREYDKKSIGLNSQGSNFSDQRTGQGQASQLKQKQSKKQSQLDLQDGDAFMSKVNPFRQRAVNENAMINDIRVQDLTSPSDFNSETVGAMVLKEMKHLKKRTKSGKPSKKRAVTAQRTRPDIKNPTQRPQSVRPGQKMIDLYQQQLFRDKTGPQAFDGIITTMPSSQQIITPLLRARNAAWSQSRKVIGNPDAFKSSNQLAAYRNARAGSVVVEGNGNEHNQTETQDVNF